MPVNMKKLEDIVQDIQPLSLDKKIELIKIIADMLKKDNYDDLTIASSSSQGFWNNSIDSEVWNNV